MTFDDMKLFIGDYMREILVFSAMFLTLLLFGCTAQNSQPLVNDNINNQSNAGTAVSVSIKNFAFSPNAVTVNRGTTVTWVNEDSVAHTVSGESFESDSLSQGQSFSFTFNDSGTFSYSCSIHPSMKGTIAVN